MEKVKAFFKKVYDLFIASNRWMHMIAGGIIYIFMVAATAIWNPYDPDALQAIFVGTLATLIPMVAVEYKDMAHGGDFDWKDIIAGMTPPVLIDILCVILMLCK
jgi:hypothetical protein